MTDPAVLVAFFVVGLLAGGVIGVAIGQSYERGKPHPAFMRAREDFKREIFYCLLPETLPADGLDAAALERAAEECAAAMFPSGSTGGRTNDRG